MIDDPRLNHLGGQLEQAIGDRIGSKSSGLEPMGPAGGPGHTGPRRGAGRALTLVAGSLGLIGLLVWAAVVVLDGTREEPEQWVSAGAPIQVEVAPPADAEAGRTFSAEDFATLIFVNLPMSDGTPVTCTSPSDLRFTCTGQQLLSPPDQQRYEMQFVIKQGWLLAGACRQQRADMLTWDCSLSQAAIDDGMLDRHRFEELID